MPLKTQNFHASEEMLARFGYGVTLSPARNGVRSWNTFSTISEPNRGGRFQVGTQTQSGTSLADASTVASLSP